jgi:hypothetical protein
VQVDSNDEDDNTKNKKTKKTKKIIIYMMQYACKTLIFTSTFWNPRVLCNTICETVLDTLDMANAASWQMEFLPT